MLWAFGECKNRSLDLTILTLFGKKSNVNIANDIQFEVIR